ncbi:shikimate dehydrogenase [Candidatus Bathyarchaeota archaeon]|nr:shikimate dehydrogenase [Candidatus Bathyarchaeota archaeon]MBS7631328.1 shikimate dehydrogenase [Candidatus Bathyarchaeota archaeon]
MKTCYLIGYPLGHSMSAVMHNAAFQSLGLDYRFKLAEVKERDLESFVESSLRSSETRGASVTIPYKILIMDYLDELDTVAKHCKSVNTIVNEEGFLKGYNTDGIGALRSLSETCGSLKGSKVLVIGAGGASRAVCYHLSLLVRELTIANRTLETAEALAESLTANPMRISRVSAKPLHELKKLISDVDIVINTTPIGMYPDTDSTPLEAKFLKPSLLVFDIVYNPPKTKLLREAETIGARTLSGIDMLVYQGSEAFRLWTGLEAPERVMKIELRRVLGEGF